MQKTFSRDDASLFEEPVRHILAQTGIGADCALLLRRRTSVDDESDTPLISFSPCHERVRRCQSQSAGMERARSGSTVSAGCDRARDSRRSVTLVE